MSDSHDNLTKVRLAMALFRDAGCDLVIHAGDIVAPLTALQFRAVGCLVRAVFGNCDGEKPGLVKAFEGWGEIREAPFAFSHAGLRFLVTHLDAPVERLLASTPCDVLVFGHTHRPAVRGKDGAMLINPGETGGWLTGASTVALFDPDKRTADIVPLA